MTTENNNNHGPEIITRTTPAPWSIVRTLILGDGLYLENVRITAEHKDAGQGGDWSVDLTRFNSLTEDLVEEAFTAASNEIGYAAERLELGGMIYADPDRDAQEAEDDQDIREELITMLVDFRKLDRNGHAAITDGSLDGYTTAERIEIIRNAIDAITGKSSL